MLCIKVLFIRKLNRTTKTYKFIGENDEKEIIGNEFGRTVAVVSYLFDRASRLLERVVF